MFFPNEAMRNQAQAAPTTDGIRVLKKEYLVELMGVPRDLGVKRGRDADNSKLIYEIQEASKSLTGTIRVTRLDWLHGEEKERGEGSPGSPINSQTLHSQHRGKVNGSLIVALASQADQRHVVKRGLVIRGQLLHARLFDMSLKHKQCFNCSQWGHLATACSKPAKCGQCAGAHSTNHCQQTTICCPNCGKKDHRAWQKAKCRVFTAYRDEVMRRKAAYAIESEKIRAGETTPTLQPVFEKDDWELVNPRKRKVGRPSGITIAARHPSQTRLAPQSTQDTFSISGTQDSEQMTTNPEL